jgi:hypothetical protein
MNNDSQSEKIKRNVTINNMKDQDIDIEKLVKNSDLNVSIIFYGNAQNFGEKINQEDIKNNVFTYLKKQYSMNDLVVQKIYQLYLSDKTGMISFMGLDTFSDNIGYNEYPVQFESNQERDSVFSYTFSSASLNLDLSSFTESSSSSNIIQQSNTQNKSNSLHFENNKNYGKIKSVNFEENSIKGSSTFKAKLKVSDGLFKHQNNDTPSTTNVEIKPIEDIDFLSKFKESLKRKENELKGDNKDKDDDKNNKNDNNQLRKSTLKDGILCDNDQDNDEDSDDE